MKMKININMNNQAIKQLASMQKKALELTADALLAEVRNAQVMPFYTGTLQNNSTFTEKSESNSGIVRIVSSTPYARRLYYHPEYNFFQGKNACAGGRWFDDWLSGSKKSWCRDTYIKIYKRLTEV